MIRDILETGVRGGACPGGVLALGHRGEAPEVFAFGTRDGKVQAEPDTIYDVASLTKPMATVAVTMKLCAAGKMRLDDALARYVPATHARAPGVTLRQLLGHAAGFPAHVKLYEKLHESAASSPREALLSLAAQVPLEAPPGARAVYSDIGFILLGAACEAAGGDRLDALARRLVFEPLGMTRTRFVDLLAEPAERVPGAAPTFIEGGAPVAGRVHDDNARAGGGIFGHAGLFSTAGDVARFCAAMAALAAGEGIGGFDPALAGRLFSQSAAPETTWRLGWDTPAADRTLSHAGTRWPQTSLGHLGFTGCSMWFEPARGVYAVLLTNRVFIDAAPAAIRDFRRQVMDAAWQALAAKS